MSNLIIVPKKNGYLVRNQNNNREMAIFKTKQDAQVFIKNYKAGKLNVHSHGQNNHAFNVHSNGNSMPMHSQQYPTSSYPNMMYPQMQGQMYPNMMYPQMQGQMYPNMMYPQMQGQMYTNMMYPQQFPNQPYSPNMMGGYGMPNNMSHPVMNQQCECGYIYNNDEYEDEIDEEDDFLDFETDSPELIKPPEISEMNKTLDTQKTESEKPKINDSIEQIPKEQETVIVEKEQIIIPEVIEEKPPVVNVEPMIAEPIVVKEPTIMMSDLTNFSIEDNNNINNNNDKASSVPTKQNDTTNLSKKELKNLKKQQKQELKLIKKQEKRNKHIYDEMEDYDF